MEFVNTFYFSNFLVKILEPTSSKTLPQEVRYKNMISTENIIMISTKYHENCHLCTSTKFR